VLFKIFVETIILFKDKFKDKKNESYVKSFIMEFIHFRLLFYDFVPFYATISDMSDYSKM